MTLTEHLVPAADRLMTVAEAAAYLNVTDRFIRRLIAERRVSFVKLGRLVRIRCSELDLLVESGSVAGVVK